MQERSGPQVPGRRKKAPHALVVVASTIALSTSLAAAAGLVGWVFLDRYRDPAQVAPAGSDTAQHEWRIEIVADGGLDALPPFDGRTQALNTVFQILKKHFARYTPEMVEQVTGCPKEKVVEVAKTLLNNSGPDKTSAICYAVGWTQHTYGVQMIGTAATLQLLLGNIGRPGGGVMALRGHATIQGSTDVPTLYHSQTHVSGRKVHGSAAPW